MELLPCEKCKTSDDIRIQVLWHGNYSGTDVGVVYCSMCTSPEPFKFDRFDPNEPMKSATESWNTRQVRE